MPRSPFAKGGKGIVWTSDTLTPGIDSMAPKVQAAVGAVMQFHEPQVESYMKTTAPWTDRTTNARNGLAARYVFNPPHTHAIVCYHQMPYGIWLEIRFAGKYRVIVPTILNQGAEVMRTLVALFKRMV